MVEAVHKQLIALPRAVKRLVVIAMDVLLSVLATWIAFTLRLDTPHVPSGAQWLVYGLAPLLAVPVFIRFGLYRAIFRYSGQAALLATTQAVAVYAAMLSAVLLLWGAWFTSPRSLGLLQPLAFLPLVAISRATARFWLAGLSGRASVPAGRLLIYGAGMAGVETAAGLAVSRGFVPVGFLDDDSAKVGRSINGINVFSPTQVLALVQRLGVTDILLALPSVSRERRNDIIASLREVPVHVRTLPGLADLASGRVSVQDFRELDLEDLLGRAAVKPQAELLASKLVDQAVLVTGAGGSIGSELCRQIVLERPRRLLLLDHNEFGLYSIHSELVALCRVKECQVELIPLLGSVANRGRLDTVCTQYRPDVVFHAAAYKHVPMVECNPAEGVLNNVFGTLNLAQAAADAGVKRFVLVSTDKAVRPTNVMGASKRMAELVLQALQERFGGAGTCFSMVRFGNVLGSSGSVVPLFREQLTHGGPLTVTHPDVTRYFMTIPEAAQLVLQAAALARGGEVFVLDMGEPVKIMDLARRMVELSGLKVKDDRHPEGDIEIVITGLRAGEKLYEELLIGNNPSATTHPRIMKAHEEFMTWPELSTVLEKIRLAAIDENVEAIKQVLTACVQGYRDEGIRERRASAVRLS
ncbi:MAG: polysaccharide biosynthesis protein [Rhodoferax sp.]|nr:polysaccharide biosynthesis protein [Rhodoferax sp.]